MHYDVIIVGGGPAGSIAGITLINKGYNVLIVDKHKFPRDKACGGGISCRVFRRFAWLSEAIQSIPIHYVNKVCFSSPDGTVAYEEREEPIYLMIRRCDFDTMLLDKCRQGGIDVLEGQKVTQIACTSDTIEVTTNTGRKITGNLVIGADGVYSVIAKQSGLNPGWPADKIAIDFMEETPSEQFQSKTTDTMYVFYGFKDSSGYGYIFPKKDHLNIGIGILWPFFKQKIHDKPYRVYKQFLDFLSKNNYVKGQSQRRNFHGYFLPVGGPLQRTFTHRVLLCGDAAGFVNAFTGEGIYYAMVSGEHAAKVALRALERNDFSEKSLSTYQTNWQREIGKELEVSVAIQRESFKRRHLIDFIVKAAQKNDLLRRSLAEYATGELGYQELKRRAIFHFAPFYLEYKLRKIFQFTSKTG